MFDIFAKLLSSVATFLFPVFASYKALKTSDPALLTPWLMYWVVLACVLLVESWTEFILVWIPFYPWLRAGFLLYLIAPQTQGARVMYQEYVHPFLHEHEVAIEDFIASAHERAKTAGLSYLKQAIDLVKQHALGLPPSKPPPAASSSLSYTQSLINRFNLPSARPSFPASNFGNAATSTATDFYSLLASAVTAATASPAAYNSQFNFDGTQNGDLSNSGTLIPPTVQGSDRMSFISAQRERLSILLSALDKEASELKTQGPSESASSPEPNMSVDGNEDAQIRPSSAMSGLSKSRSELEFERIDTDVEEEPARPGQNRTRSGTWLPWSWGAKAVEPVKPKETDQPVTDVDQGVSTGVQT